MLSKNLTREIWDKLKDAKDAHNFSFKASIFPGCQNEDAEIGVYAGSEYSFTAFNDLMSPIIKQYHDVDLE